MINRRIDPRINFESENIKILIMTPNSELFYGAVRDLSKSGISFYSEQSSLIDVYRPIINVMFVMGEKLYLHEMEVLREEKHSLHTVHAGRFIGTPVEIPGTDLQDILQEEVVLA